MPVSVQLIRQLDQVDPGIRSVLLAVLEEIAITTLPSYQR